MSSRSHVRDANASTKSSIQMDKLLRKPESVRMEEASESSPRLKHHYPAIWLIIFYIPIVIVPWIATVVLNYRPISSASYRQYYGAGNTSTMRSGVSRSTYYYPDGFSFKQYKSMQSWVTAIDVLNSIASILAVPIISFVIAQMAVIYSQKRAPAHQLSVRDVFALADRAWADVSVLAKILRAKGRGRGSSPFNRFIVLATGLILISALQPPLYQILVGWKSIQIPYGILWREKLSKDTFIDHEDLRVLGSDAEPAVMEMIPHATVLQRVQFELPSINRRAPYEYMWVDYNGTQSPPVEIEFQQGNSLNSMSNAKFKKTLVSHSLNVLPVFFASFPFNVTTGTKRHHVMRFNSTVDCEVLTKDKFPAECSGAKPYTNLIQVRNATSSSELRICVPGRWGTSPWTLSRNRQDVVEEVYFQFVEASNNNATSTIRCESATTRGYFELGNYKTGDQYGPLLEHWPSPHIMEGDFNDLGQSCGIGDAMSCGEITKYIPTEWDTYRSVAVGWTPEEPEYMRWNMSGPLVTSVMALFNNNSWIQTATLLSSLPGNSSSANSPVSAPIWWERICEQQPLFKYSPLKCEPDVTPGAELDKWFRRYFNATGKPSVGYMEELLFNSIALTHKAVLLTHRETDAPRLLWNTGGREIHFRPAFHILKPHVSLASMVVISVLLAIQVVGLVLCAVHISRTPTWTRVFNAMAVARIGAALEKEQLPGDGEYAEDGDYERLREAQIPLEIASAAALRRRRVVRETRPAWQKTKWWPLI